MIADYEYYSKQYGGTKIAEADFLRLSNRAAAYVCYLTFDRALSCNLDCVKDAVCAVAEEYAAEEARGGIQSENNDGYSVTYEGGAKSAEEKRYAIVRENLAHTGLMYRGVYNDN